MSTVAQELDIAPPLEPAPQTQAATLRWLGKNAWALADQVLISAANFITMVLTARSLGVSEFGDFTLVFSALLLTNILQSTLITQPHNVLGSGMEGDGYRRYTSTAALGQLALSALLALLATCVGFVGQAQGWRAAPMLMALPVTILAWQGMEFVRRVLYTEGRLRDAFINDMISYGGQTILIALMWWNNTLTGQRALLAMAVACATATLIGCWQLRRSLARHLDRRAFAENWHFGKWLAGAEILGYFASINMYMYLAALMLGTSATGEMKAAQILFGPTRVLAFFLGTILPIRFARTLAEGGEMAVHQQMKSVYRLVAPLMGAYCLLMVLTARPLLKLVYTEAFTGGAVVLMLYACAAFLNYMEMVVSAALSAKRLTRYIFGGYVFSATIALSLSWLFIKLLGGRGAIVCMIVTAALVLLSFLRAYFKSLHGRGFSPLAPAPEVAT